MKHSEVTNATVVLEYPAPWNGPVRFSLQSHYDTHRGAGDLETLLSYSRELAPCVVMMDSNTLRKHSETHQNVAVARNEHLQIIVVHEGAAPPSLIRESLCLGCKGVLDSRASPETIRKAIDVVSAGEIWAPRQLVADLLQRCLFQLGPNALTQRERDILELIAKGCTNKEIAQVLFITRETVRWHIRSLYSKIGASDRLSAAVYAKEVFLFPKESIRLKGEHRAVEVRSAARQMTTATRTPDKRSS